MCELYPHQVFRMEYRKMLLEASRQENIHPANVGELATTQGILAYLEEVAIPLMMKNDWVFEAVEQFALEYATDCFDAFERTGIQATRARNEKAAIDDEVTDFIAKANVCYNAIDIPEHDDPEFLHKASDFYGKLRLGNLPPEKLAQAKRLHRKAADFERRYLKTALEISREDYETVLPRVMVTVRRVVRIEKNLPYKPSYTKLLGISDSLDWYEAHINQAHPLYPITSWLTQYYKVVRNVASHVKGMQWDPSSNRVVLADNSFAIESDDREFIQRYRYLMTICEMGAHAILVAYSERCQDKWSAKLAGDYIEMIRRIGPNHPTYGNTNVCIRSYC